MGKKNKMVEKEELREAYRDFGWSIGDLAERYGLTEEEVRRLIGKEALGEWKERQQEEKITGAHKQHFLKTSLEDKRALKEKETTIESFRSRGCAISRCPKCGAIMDDARVEENEEEFNFYYECPDCGYVDWKDKSCGDKCCREGLARIVALRYGEGLDIDPDSLTDYLNNFIKTGRK